MFSLSFLHGHSLAWPSLHGALQVAVVRFSFEANNISTFVVKSPANDNLDRLARVTPSPQPSAFVAFCETEPLLQPGAGKMSPGRTE